MAAEGFTENIGLPLELLEKHDPWPANVTYSSPMVKRLIEKSKIRELQCKCALEESRQAWKPKQSSSVIQPKRRKSSRSSGGDKLKDAQPEVMISVWDSGSALFLGPTVAPEPKNLQTDSRESPTADYNKIIFSQKSMMRMLPFSSLQASKEKQKGPHGHLRMCGS
ncbi:CMT1A duplicated region transcript 4 protein [Ctenodactylus gundi]